MHNKNIDAKSKCVQYIQPSKNIAFMSCNFVSSYFISWPVTWFINFTSTNYDYLSSLFPPFSVSSTNQLVCIKSSKSAKNGHVPLSMNVGLTWGSEMLSIIE